MSDITNQKHKIESLGTLGTFTGVFTPSVLTILGIILFLRLGFVVGSTGLMRALIMVGIANAISILTSISLSAIATNLKVKRGGDYYLISRTLGVEFGGSIGVVLFMAQAVSIAFYSIGFGEALVSILPDALAFSPRLIAGIAVCLLFILAWLGSDWAARFQYLVMVLLGFALISFFTGSLMKWDTALLLQNVARPAEAPPFWYIFAIFFPAVTGFTQGVSMSGDLKNPGESLPKGTFAAVFISIAVYVSVTILFAATSPLDVLSRDYSIMKHTAYWGVLIDAGVIAATLSSAMASFMGAPRILQSLASDRIFPVLNPFSKGSGKLQNPRRGVLLSGGIALVTIALGNLNVIAPIVSMFFLISYGLLNYATYYEARGESPSFRPTFKWFDRRLSLAGCIACLGVMLAIDLSTGLVAISILFAIYHYLKRRRGPSRWADSRRSYYFQEIRNNLLAAEKEPVHPRNWRPKILAISNYTERRKPLLIFASWLQGRSGFVTAVKILLGKGLKMVTQKNQAEIELKQDIRDLGIDAFHLALVTPDVESGVQSLVQSYGIGPLKANTMILNWKGAGEVELFTFEESRYSQHLKTAFRLGCNIIALNPKSISREWLLSIPEEKRRIDVWWSKDKTGQLMILLAFLITRNELWKNTKIQVNVVKADHHPRDVKHQIENLLEDARIDAQITLYSEFSSNPFSSSEDAALVFFPFYFSKNTMVCPFHEDLEELIRPLPPVALVLAREDIDLDAEPEEGKPAEVASAMDEAEKARKIAEKAKKDAADADQLAGELLDKLEKTMGSDLDEKVITDLVSKAMKAREKAENASKRAAKKAFKAEDKDQVLKQKMDES